MQHSHTTRKLRHLVQVTAPGLLALFAYKPSWLAKDIAAGLSVAAIALPVGIAYAELAGVPPIVGVYSAIFPLFAYALFGSSHQLMTGSDAATCILVAATLGPLAGGDPERYATLLLGLTVMTGLLYIFAGVIKLGFIANFLSQPTINAYLKHQKAKGQVLVDADASYPESDEREWRGQVEPLRKKKKDRAQTP